jgi:eukaryotic-like serine/threonine-protein kinase
MLADFGVARALDLADADGRLTATGAVVGTVRYMSPEQLRGDPVDARADVFALGSLLFEMLAGAPPYRGVAMLALVRRGSGGHVRADVRRHRDDVPDAAAEIIGRAIAADPAERPTSADLAATLAAALADPTA